MELRCRYFRGDVPCKWHKLYQVECNGGCPYLDRWRTRILIIKLGAAGDVIRTTPLLEAIKRAYPDSYVIWLTEYPMLVEGLVDKVYKWTYDNILILRNTTFDIIYSLDKDYKACALASELQGDRLYGFVLRDGVPMYANERARPKFMTGISDALNKANRLHYVKEIFELCGYQFNGERYKLPWNFPMRSPSQSGDKIVVGLNTGCGARWESRRYPEEYWVELARMLKNRNYDVILLGGPEEVELNRRIAKASDVEMAPVGDLYNFAAVIHSVDVVVTVVTMALHMAIALEKRIVLLNNIFNPYEFYLYGLGEIIEPHRKCDCYFSPKCVHERSCLYDLPPEVVMEAVERQASMIFAIST